MSSEPNISQSKAIPEFHRATPEQEDMFQTLLMRQHTDLWNKCITSYKVPLDKAQIDELQRTIFGAIAQAWGEKPSDETRNEAAYETARTILSIFFIAKNQMINEPTQRAIFASATEKFLNSNASAIHEPYEIIKPGETYTALT